MERIVDQRINVTSTDRSANHKNGEEKTAFKKIAISNNFVTENPLCEKVLFLKQNCVKVSSRSEKIRVNNILGVSFFLNIRAISYIRVKILGFQEYRQ